MLVTDARVSLVTLMDMEVPRRAPRSRKLPSRLRSPSPKPLSAQRPEIARAASPVAITDHAPNPDAQEGEQATGPGKRHRRPSSMYKPPEALTADVKRASPVAMHAKPKSAARPHPKPLSLVKKEGDEVRTPTRITLRVPPQSASAVDDVHTPATFTRRGERMTEPIRKKATRADNETGIMSPKPVRTASGVWRMSTTLFPNQDEEDEDEDDLDEEGAGEVARNTLQLDLAERAWSIAMSDTPKPILHVDEQDLCADSDGDEDDFHQTMLHDDELDMLTRADSPKDSDEDAPLTDGHVTTPASCGAKDSPVEARSCSPALSNSASSPPMEGRKDPVFSHCLPVPHVLTNDLSVHAGSITLSLPFDLTQPTSHTNISTGVGDSVSSPILDAHGETPLTPVHSHTVSSPDEDEEKERLCSLVPPTLPSDLSQVKPIMAPSLSSSSPLSNIDEGSEQTLLDTAFETGEPAAVSQETAHKDAWINAGPSLHMSLDDTDMDPFLGAPEKMFALTDLDRAWNLAIDCDADSAEAPKRPRSVLTHGKRPRSADGSYTSQSRTRMSRLRSRAL